MSKTLREVVTLSGKIVRETDKALLFRIISREEDSLLDGKSSWFPISQLTQIHRTFSIVSETDDTIVVAEWIARKNGMIEQEVD